MSSRDVDQTTVPAGHNFVPFRSSFITSCSIFDIQSRGGKCWRRLFRPTRLDREETLVWHPRFADVHRGYPKRSAFRRGAISRLLLISQSTAILPAGQCWSPRSSPFHHHWKLPAVSRQDSSRVRSSVGSDACGRGGRRLVRRLLFCCPDTSHTRSNQLQSPTGRHSPPLA